MAGVRRREAKGRGVSGGNWRGWGLCVCVVGWVGLLLCRLHLVGSVLVLI